jgi:hypothetical protein
MMVDNKLHNLEVVKIIGLHAPMSLGGFRNLCELRVTQPQIRRALTSKQLLQPSNNSRESFSLYSRLLIR